MASGAGATCFQFEFWGRMVPGVARHEVGGFVSIMYCGCLSEGSAEANGERFLENAPGVYLHKDATQGKAEHYLRFVQLPPCSVCGQSIGKWQLFVPTMFALNGVTDQWIQSAQTVELVAILVCASEAEEMVPSSLAPRPWDPMKEASPMTSQAFHKAATEAGMEFPKWAPHRVLETVLTQKKVGASRQLRYSLSHVHDASDNRHQAMLIYCELSAEFAYAPSPVQSVSTQRSDPSHLLRQPLSWDKRLWPVRVQMDDPSTMWTRRKQEGSCTPSSSGEEENPWEKLC